jgi:hypothetical protein
MSASFPAESGTSQTKEHLLRAAFDPVAKPAEASAEFHPKKRKTSCRVAAYLATG